LVKMVVVEVASGAAEYLYLYSTEKWFGAKTIQSPDEI
jgi:hypothetical protein